MEPLAVTFKLVGPIIEPSQPLHLDALLGRCAADAAILRNEDPNYSVEHLPLQQHDYNNLKVWCASAFIFVKQRPVGMLHRMRRSEYQGLFDASNLGLLFKPQRTVNAASGALRAWSFTRPMVLASEARAWCIGDRAQLNELLSTVHYIGALGKLGYGHIEGMEIKADPAANWKWLNRDLPDVPAVRREIDGKDLFADSIDASFRPPYWDHKNRTRCLRCTFTHMHELR